MNDKQKMVSFSIERLFDWNKSIECNLDFDQGINFLSGRNGSGKTTVIKLIHALSSSNWSYISKIKFRKFSVKFKSISSPDRVSEINIYSDSDGSRKISVRHSGDSSPTITQFPTLDSSSAKLHAETLFRQGVITKAFCGRHWASSFNNHMTDAEAVEAHGRHLMDAKHDPTIQLIRARILNQWHTHLIETSRLYSDTTQNNQGLVFNSAQKNQGLSLNVDNVPNTIRNAIVKVDQRSSVDSQKLESKLVNDILSSAASESSSITVEELVLQLGQMNKHQQQLKKIGLYTGSQNYHISFDGASKEKLQAAEKVLSVFKDRIKPYLSLLNKINIFDELLTAVCPGLSFDIDRKKGLLINSGKIEPCDLSSGQQHQLLMLCNLVFERTESELILIDEPEMSMDIEWQNEIAARLDKIADFNGCNFLLATHSPTVVANRWKNEYDLSK